MSVSPIAPAVAAVILIAALVPDAAADEPGRTPETAASSIRVAPVDEPGIPLEVEGVVTDGNRPVAGALIHVYHTDRTGCYSPGCRDESRRRLHGYLKTDAEGRFRFDTIRPASYPDSNVQQHIHFEIRAPGHRTGHGEILFADDPKLSERQRRSGGTGSNVVAEVETREGRARIEVELRVVLD